MNRFFLLVLIVLNFAVNTSLFAGHGGGGGDHRGRSEHGCGRGGNHDWHHHDCHHDNCHHDGHCDHHWHGHYYYGCGWGGPCYSYNVNLYPGSCSTYYDPYSYYDYYQTPESGVYINVGDY